MISYLACPKPHIRNTKKKQNKKNEKQKKRVEKKMQTAKKTKDETFKLLLIFFFNDAKTTNKSQKSRSFCGQRLPAQTCKLCPWKKRDKNLFDQIPRSRNDQKSATKDGMWFRIGRSAQPAKRAAFVAGVWAGVRDKKSKPALSKTRSSRRKKFSEKLKHLGKKYFLCKGKKPTKW
jgi:hypothetical protein